MEVIRQAKPADSDAIRALYGAIHEAMKTTGEAIWDDVYPMCMVDEDIAHQRAFVLEAGEEIVGVYVLTASEKTDLAWEHAGEQSGTLARMGVHPSRWNRGDGQRLLQSAKAQAAKQGYVALRLLVVDWNRRAMHAYERCGFHLVAGVHSLDTGERILRETGYECLLKK